MTTACSSKALKRILCSTPRAARTYRTAIAMPMAASYQELDNPLPAIPRNGRLESAKVEKFRGQLIFRGFATV